MKRPHPTRVLVAAVLLPVLFGSLVLWSLGDRVERLDSVPAAVVNLDDPVRTGKGEDRQTVAAGRLLAAGLTSPTDESEQSLGWGSPGPRTPRRACATAATTRWSRSRAASRGPSRECPGPTPSVPRSRCAATTAPAPSWAC